VRVGRIAPEQASPPPEMQRGALPFPPRPARQTNPGAVATYNRALLPSGFRMA
jgi:hypothetical protein